MQFVKLGDGADHVARFCFLSWAWRHRRLPDSLPEAKLFPECIF
jgi:hypothetical protein